MATCHPHVISVFFIRLVLNAITANSQLRPWRENKQQHEHLIYLFWRLFLHFCEYISTSFQSFKAVKQMFIVFLMKLCIFNNFELMTFYHVQGQTHVLLKLVILRLNKQT